MKVLKVSGNTYCIDTGISNIPFYKVKDKEIILLDTGLAQGERGILDKYFDKEELKVVGILCTHAHTDHIGNAAYYREKYNCKVAMSEEEAFICKSITNLRVYFSLHSTKFIEENFSHLVCNVDIIIKASESQVIMDGISFKITHNPGHSIGHICITTPDNVTYLGDSLISYEVMEKAKLPYAFMIKEDLISKEGLYSLDSHKYILSHKGIYDNIDNLIVDNIEFYKDRAAKLCELINEPLLIDELINKVSKAWNINVKSIKKYRLIERMIMPYINYLVQMGYIKEALIEGSLKYIRE